METHNLNAIKGYPMANYVRIRKGEDKGIASFCHNKNVSVGDTIVWGDGGFIITNVSTHQPKAKHPDGVLRYEVEIVPKPKG